jgi:chromosome segregation ATPase
MRSLILKINLILFIAPALVFSGCAHTTNSAKAPSVSTPPPMAENKYSQEMAALKNVVQQNSNAAETKRAHLELARLYSNHKNPQRNYQKAFEHLRTYVAIADSSINEETLNWMAALEEIDRLSVEITRLSEEITRRSEEIAQVQKALEKSNQATVAVQRTNQKLTREEIMLREKNRKLEESNQKLEKTIEMLKNLDQRLEEKRRNFTN